MVFDGATEYLEATTINPANYVTVGLRINPTAVTSGVQYLFSTYDGTNGVLLLLDGAGNVNFYVVTADNPFGTAVATTPVGIADNAEVTIIGIYDGANLYLYTNGVLRATTAATGTIATSTDPQTYIGGSQPMFGSNFYAGAIRKVVAYNIPLTGTDIAQLDAYLAS